MNTHLALSPAIILSRGPSGQIHYDLWSIAPGETWRYLDINASSLYNVATRLGFSVKRLSDTSAEVTRPPHNWSGSPCPKDPDNYWIDDITGRRIKA